jgi:(p)ppGpp synthase/HD superfamily hydrolase
MITFDTTLAFIKKAHEGQSHGSIEYWKHPLAVSELGSELFRDDFTEEAKIVALLHDVIEDTSYNTKDLLDMGYTNTIVRSVELLSKNKDLSYADNIRRITNSNDLNAIMVKYCDNAVNYSSLDDLSEEYHWMKKRYRNSMNILKEKLDSL